MKVGLWKIAHVLTCDKTDCSELGALFAHGPRRMPVRRERFVQ